MHILIGLITAIAGLLWALHSLQNAGVDLNSFNPFTWLRRRKWEKQLGVKPLHAIESTMEAAAVLTLSVAKSEGDITRDTKMEILSMFEDEFGIKRKDSIELYSYLNYLLKDVMSMETEVRHVLAPSKEDFQEAQIEKLMNMLDKASKLEGEPTEDQKMIIDAVTDEFKPDKESAANW